MKKSVSIIGSGPSALMLAAMLNENKFSVSLYEKKSAPARKFLVAGDGGLNITHSENVSDFILRYTPPSFFKNIINNFSNADLIAWLSSLGIETYIGSSKRMFPKKEFKPIDVLNAILNLLKQKGVQLFLNHEWSGWDEKNNLTFTRAGEKKTVKAHIVVFALGGASWSVTGSDGKWKKLFEEKNIQVVPFQASNCRFEVSWPEVFIKEAEGKALKNISVCCSEKQKAGELIITKSGIEGGAIYALSNEIREQLKEKKQAQILIDLKPSLSEEKIETVLKKYLNKKSITNILINQIKLSKTKVLLLKSHLSKSEFNDAELLAKKTKNLSLLITNTAPIDEAISTAGGISLEEIDQNFQLKKISSQYAIGEMLNWDAPTGGYLLQACFSMGYSLAKHLNAM